MMQDEHTSLLTKPHVSKNSPPKPHGTSSIAYYSILAALWAGAFLSIINLTMVATLLPAITSEFEGSNHVSWVGTSYLLSSCTFTPLYGRLCTILGRRSSCQASLLAIIIGTLLCGMSSSMVTLTAARFITGMGGGAIHLLAMIITADLFDIRERGFPQACIAVAQALGLGLGGPVGGLVSDLVGWRVAFLCQLPLFVLVMIHLTNTLHYVTPGQSRSAKEVLSRVDFGGCITLFFMIGSSLVWLSNKFNDDLPWTDRRVFFPLCLSIIFLVLFLLIESIFAPEPIFPTSLLRARVPLLVGLSNFSASVCNFSVMYFLPLWFQTVPLDSASIAGLHLLPDSFSMGLGSMFAGWLVRRTGRYKTINLIFGILPLCGLIPLVLLREDSWFVHRWFSVVPLGFGNGVVYQTVLIALQAHLTESQMAFGTSFRELFRGLGQTAGIAISSAVFQSRLDSELRRRIYAPNADRIITDIRHSMSLVTTLHDPLQREVRDAYAASLKTVFVMAAYATMASYAFRLPIPEKVMREQGESGSRSEEDEEEYLDRIPIVQ